MKLREQKKSSLSRVENVALYSNFDLKSVKVL